MNYAFCKIALANKIMGQIILTCSSSFNLSSCIVENIDSFSSQIKCL